MSRAQHTQSPPPARSGAVRGVLPWMVGDGEGCAAVDGLVAVRGVLPSMSGNHFTWSLRLSTCERLANSISFFVFIRGKLSPAPFLCQAAFFFGCVLAGLP